MKADSALIDIGRTSGAYESEDKPTMRKVMNSHSIQKVGDVSTPGVVVSTDIKGEYMGFGSPPGCFRHEAQRLSRYF